mgnify:CR=1 FL=1
MIFLKTDLGFLPYQMFYWGILQSNYYGTLWVPALQRIDKIDAVLINFVT